MILTQTLPAIRTLARSSGAGLITSPQGITADASFFPSDGHIQPRLTLTSAVLPIHIASIIHSDAKHFLAAVTMSNTDPPASTSNLKDTFEAALTAYEKKTKERLRTQALMNDLNALRPQPPASDQILILLRAQVQKTENSASGNDRFIAWLDPIVNVLCVSSSVTNAVVGLVNHIRIILRVQPLISYF